MAAEDDDWEFEPASPLRTRATLDSDSPRIGAIQVSVQLTVFALCVVLLCWYPPSRLDASCHQLLVCLHLADITSCCVMLLLSCRLRKLARAASTVNAMLKVLWGLQPGVVHPEVLGGKMLVCGTGWAAEILLVLSRPG